MYRAPARLIMPEFYRSVCIYLFLTVNNRRESSASSITTPVRTMYMGLFFLLLSLSCCSDSRLAVKEKAVCSEGGQTDSSGIMSRFIVRRKGLAKDLVWSDAFSYSHWAVSLSDRPSRAQQYLVL